MANKPQEVFDFAELWESGVDLDAAWLRHSPTVEPFDLVALRTHPDNDEALRGNPRYELLGEWLPPTYELRQEKLKETIETLRHYLLSLLYDGNLWAVGCLKREDDSEEKVFIPREYFFYPGEDGKSRKNLAWREGVLRVDDKRFFDIRVVIPLPVDPDDECDLDTAATGEHEAQSVAEAPDDSTGPDRAVS